MEVNALGRGLDIMPNDSTERREIFNSDEKIKIETDTETIELLGSVTTHKCPGTRTSARVIQKMKQDQTRPITPPPIEREIKREEKNMQKTPSQVRTNKSSWSNLERNYFFDALNEFGKDFDAIGNYINTKLKRKSTTDISFKTKEQVRQHYYQTYHKICKYIKFSEEIKKPAQELYALINYGEMRRKLQFITDKHYMKLRVLIYQGYITVRCKGKNIRIKTPSCKALRRLNQLDDSLEDLRLPSKIEVIITPANMQAFGRVQTMAQNPHVRTTVPLHKKLVNFIKTFQYKWRSPDVKIFELETKSLTQSVDISTNTSESLDSKLEKLNVQDPEMCFLPKPGVTIHRPLLSITEYLSSVNICLTAYEERIGVKIRSESLNFERGFNKRQRSDSDSDKRSPDAKKLKVITGVSLDRADVHHVNVETNESEASHSKSESSGDELNDEINELLGEAENCVKEDIQQTLESVLVKNESNTVSSTLCLQSHGNSNQSLVRTKQQRNTNSRTLRGASLTFKPLVSEDVIRRIRKGWTVSNAIDITIGDLYVVFGQDSRLELNYYWTDNSSLNTEALIKGESPAASSPILESNGIIFGQKQNKTNMPYNPNECDDPRLLQNISNADVSSKLKHLLLIANLSERVRKRQCSCGHTCSNATKTRIDRELASKTFISPKTYRNSGSGEVNTIFRQPIAPIRRPMVTMDPVKQLTTLTRAKLSRQVLVQRVLLPGAISNLANDTKRDTVLNQSVLHTSGNANEIYKNESANAFSKYPTTSNIESSSTNFSHIATGAANLEHHKDNNIAKIEGINLLAEDEANDKEELNTEPVNPFEDISLSSSNLFSSLSPMHLIRESTSTSRWLEENLNDFSLTSLLGHLDEINAGRNDILDPSSNLSVISESSVDFRHKFQEITASMQNQDNE